MDINTENLSTTINSNPITTEQNAPVEQPNTTDNLQENPLSSTDSASFSPTGVQLARSVNSSIETSPTDAQQQAEKISNDIRANPELAIAAQSSQTTPDQVPPLLNN